MILSLHGNPELSQEEEPPSLDTIRELERLLYVKNQTHLLWKPAPTEVPRQRLNDIMKPINISRLDMLELKKSSDANQDPN